MPYEMTIQIRVLPFESGLTWYRTLFQREPDFVPHEGLAEWELVPGCWLQVAGGIRRQVMGRFGSVLPTLTSHDIE